MASQQQTNAMQELKRRAGNDPTKLKALNMLASKRGITIETDTVFQQEALTPGEKGAATYKKFTQMFTGRPASEAPAGEDPYETLAKEQNLAQSLAISTGKGLVNIGRGLGLVDPASEAETKGMQALEEERPVSSFVGEAVGESLPFAAAPVGLLGTGGKVVATGLLGALESGIIARGKGASEGEQAISAGAGGTVAATAQALMPKAFRYANKLFRKITGKAPKGSLFSKEGVPTEEFNAALKKENMTIEDFGQESIETLQKTPAVPEQAARAGRFEQMDLPATKGDISQKFAQQAEEARLFESAADPASDPLRNVRLQQSQVLTQKLDDNLTKSGVPKNLGDNLKGALSGRKTNLRKKKNELYQDAAARAEDVGGLPIDTIPISEAMPDARTIARLGRIKGAESEAAMDLLAEFGVDQSDDALRRLEQKGIEVEPLTIENFDDFRMALNQVQRSDTTGAASIITKPIKDALDNEADNLVVNLQKGGVTDENILKPLKEARQIVRQMKTEFSPDSITGKLINLKRDGFTEVIESSKVFDNIVGTNKPIEFLERTVKSLEKSGEAGQTAIGDLQAATVMDLMEHAFKANTRKVQGQKLFGTTAFVKRMQTIGDDKLKTIFKNNPEGYRELKRIQKVSEDLIPPSGAVPKGSASANMDAVISLLGRIPKMGTVFNGMNALARMGSNEKAVRQAMETRPEIRQVAGLLEQKFPSIFTGMGLAGAAGTAETITGEPQQGR